jgi:replicative DNA helicase
MEERANESFVLLAQMQVLKLLIDYPDIEAKGITSDSFHNLKFKAYFTALQNLRESGETINETSLFREANRIDAGVDTATNKNLFSIQVDKTNLNGALEALQDSIAKNKINKALEKIQELTTSYNPLDTVKVSSLEYTIQETLATAYKQVVSKDFSILLDNYKAELLERKKGLHYPFNDVFLDQTLTKKAAPGQIVLLAGATGTGKSIYGLYLMSGLVNTDIPCLYFSPEMDEISTMDRWMAMRKNIPVDMWYSTGPEMDALIDIVDKEKIALKDKAFRFIDEPDITLEQIRHHIREFKLAYKVDYLIVFVDLITQVREFMDMSSNKNASLPTIMEKAINKVNAIAKKENVCIVAIAQMNRDADSAKITTMQDIDKLRPTLNTIKNSAALAERSRAVLSVFRAKYYSDRYLPNDEEAREEPDVLEIQVVKQNMGRVGNIGKYNFNGPTFKLNVLMEGNDDERG